MSRQIANLRSQTLNLVAAGERNMRSYKLRKRAAWVEKYASLRHMRPAFENMQAQGRLIGRAQTIGRKLATGRR